MFQDSSKFFTHVQTLCCVIDFEGYLRHTNAAWQHLGYRQSPNGLYLNWIHPDDQASTLSFMNQLQNTEVVAFTNRFRHQEGNYSYIFWQMTKVTVESAYYVVGILYSDSTPLPHFSSPQPLSNPFPSIEQTGMGTDGLSKILKNLQEAVVVQDEGGRVQSLNDRTEQILGGELGPSDFEYLWESAHQEKLTTSPIGQVALVSLQTSSGNLTRLSVRTQTFSHQGQSIRVINFQDATPQYRLEYTLEQLKQHIDFLFNTQGGMIEWDLRTEQVTYSPQWKELLGYRDMDLGHQMNGWYTRIHPAEHHHVLKEVKNCLDGITPYYEKIHRLQHKDGGYRWMQSRGMILQDEKGQACRFLFSFIDITELKRAEQALESNSKYEQAFANMNEAFLFVNSQGEITDANVAAIKLYGYQRHELLKLKSSDLFTSSLISHQTTHHKKKEGILIPVEMTVHHFTWQGQKTFVISVRDITLLRERMASLEESETYYRLVFELLPEAVIIFDTSNHQLLQANSAAIKLYAYPLENYPQLYMEDLLANPAQSTAQLRMACKQKFYKISSDWHRKRTGEIFPVEMSTGSGQIGNRNCVCAMIRDLSECLHTEEFKKTWEFTNALIQAFPAFFVTLDPTGKITLINDIFLQVLGYTREEVIGEDCLTLLIPERERTTIISNFDVLLNKRQEKISTDVMILTKENKFLLVECHCSAVSDAQGNIEHILAVGIDVGKRRRAFQELQMFKSIVENSREAIAIRGPRRSLIYINLAHKKLFKHTLEQARKSHYRDYFLPDTWRKVNREIRPVIEKEGKTWEGILDMLDTQKEHLLIRSYFNTVRDEQGNLLFSFSMMHPVSNQEKLEAELRYAYEQYETVFQYAPLSIVYKDKENRIICVNRYAADMLGMNTEQLKGVSMYDLTPEYAKEYHATDLEVICSEKPKVGLIEKHQRGFSQVDKVPYRDAQGNIQGVIVFSINITKRVKTIEQVLQKKQPLLKERCSPLWLTMETLPIMLYMIDSGFNFILWNQECEHVTGYHADEIINNPKAWELLYPEPTYREEMLTTTKEMVVNYSGFREWEWTVTCRDGAQKTILWSGTSMVDETEFALCAVGEDITEHDQVLQLLCDNEERLRILIENMPILFVAYSDPGTFVLWNRHCETITGYKAAEIIRNPKALELLYPDAEYREKILKNQKKIASFWRWETELTCKDGTTKTIAWSNISKDFPMPGWFGWMIGEDLTEFRSMPPIFKEPEFLFSALLNGINIPICITDGRGRFVYANRLYCRLHGYESNELTNAKFSSVIPHGEHHSNELRHYFRFMTNPHENTLNAIWNALHHDGYIFKVQVFARRVEIGQSYVVWTVTKVL